MLYATAPATAHRKCNNYPLTSSPLPLYFHPLPHIYIVSPSFQSSTFRLPLLIFIRHQQTKSLIFIRHQQTKSLIFIRCQQTNSPIFIRRQQTNSPVFIRHQQTNSSIFIRCQQTNFSPRSSDDSDDSDPSDDSDDSDDSETHPPARLCALNASVSPCPLCEALHPHVALHAVFVFAEVLPPACKSVYHFISSINVSHSFCTLSSSLSFRLRYSESLSTCSPSDRSAGLYFHISIL